MLKWLNFENFAIFELLRSCRLKAFRKGHFFVDMCRFLAFSQKIKEKRLQFIVHLLNLRLNFVEYRFLCSMD